MNSDTKNQYPPIAFACTITAKGGEKAKTKTKWERYYELPKDELVIRLVEEEARFRLFAETIVSMSKDGRSWCVPDVGEIPPEDWLEKIIAYAKEHVAEDDTFSYMDLLDYGVDVETADRLWKED